MINCSPELKQAFLSDRSHKNIEIEFEETDFSKVNFFSGFLAENGGSGIFTSGAQKPASTSFMIWAQANPYNKNNGIFNYIQYANFLNASGKVKIVYDSIDNTPTKIEIRLDYSISNPIGYSIKKYYDFPGNDTYIDFDFQLDISQIDALRSFELRYKLLNSEGELSGNIYNYYIQVKELQYSLGSSLSELPYDFSQLTQVELRGYDLDKYIKITPMYLHGNSIINDNIVKESLKLTESICSHDTIKFGTCESSILEFDCVDIHDDVSLSYIKAFISIDGINEKIPLGRFRINSVENTGSHNLIMKHVTAYDGIEPLNVDVTNWLASNISHVNTTSMFGVPYNDNPGAEYSMQMFSTFCSLCNYIGFDLEITEGQSYRYETTNVENPYKYYRIYGYDPQDTDKSNYYAYYEPTERISVDSSKLYRVTTDYNNSILEHCIDKGFYESIPGFNSSSCNVLIDEYDDNNICINKFCCNTNAYFALHENTKKICIYINSGVRLGDSDSDYPLWITYANLQEGTFDKFYSKNFPVRLVYYNWKDLSISIPNATARDVIRSLIEITGYFLRYGRDGQVEFIQCTKSGLYPSNTLYPSDDLHPRQGANNEALHMGRYRTFKCEDYTTADFGKIQIKLQSTNSSKAITKTYVGNASKTNTYIMDDNVFYCNSGVTYEQYTADGQTWIEPLPEVIEMFENLYEQINNLGYVPHETITPGMPWFECGDRIGILTETGGFETFVFRRTMSGIQFLTDTYEANGEKETESISDYGIYDWRN